MYREDQWFPTVVHPLKRYQSSWTGYTKDSRDFLKKSKNLGSLPENATLVTADVVGLYPWIPHESGLQALEEALENRNRKQILLTNLLRWLSLYSRKTFTNLTVMLSNRYMVQQLGQNLHHHTLVFSWTNLKLNF